MQQAYLAAGCFWGVEALFRSIDGVREVRVGYANGHTDNPTYEEVCRHTTGYAEAVRIDFDEAVIDYKTLLAHFWHNHNATTRNRQGNDHGSQYRSAIFYLNEEQAMIAEQSKQDYENNNQLNGPIVTIIEPLENFFEAEQYHQRYFEKHGQNVCSAYTGDSQ